MGPELDDVLVTLKNIEAQTKFELADAGRSKVGKTRLTSSGVAGEANPLSFWESKAKLAVANPDTSLWGKLGKLVGGGTSETIVHPCGSKGSAAADNGDDDKAGSGNVDDFNKDIGDATPATIHTTLHTLLQKLRELGESGLVEANLWHRSRAALAMMDLGLGLRVNATFWGKVPVNLAGECLHEVHELMRMQLSHIVANVNKKEGGGALTMVQLTVLLKTVTITDMLTNTMAAHLPSIVTPWILGLLGVWWEDPQHNVAPVFVQGPWRSSLLKMRAYWGSRLPSIGWV